MILQFGRFEIVNVYTLMKRTNTCKVNDLSCKESGDTWTWPLSKGERIKVLLTTTFKSQHKIKYKLASTI